MKFHVYPVSDSANTHAFMPHLLGFWHILKERETTFVRDYALVNTYFSVHCITSLIRGTALLLSARCRNFKMSRNLSLLITVEKFDEENGQLVHQ
eukprot:Em0559g2a